MTKKTVMIVIPSDGGFGWIVVLASFWLTFVLEGCVMVFSIYKASLKEELNVSQMHVMTIYSFQMGVFFLAGPLNSLIIQWIGFRPSSIIGILSLAVGYALASLTNNFIVTLITYGIMGGFGSGMAYQVAIIMVSYYFEKYRAIATGIVMCGSALGGVIISFTFQRFLDRFGRTNTFLLQSGIAACSLLCVLAFRMPPMTEIQVESEDDAKAATAKPYRSRKSLGDAEQTFASRSKFDPLEKTCCQRYCSCFTGDRNDADYKTRPLDRKDVFFGCSVDDLNRITGDERRLSSRPAVGASSASTAKNAEAIKGDKICGICPATLGQTLVRMMDCRLFTSPTFCILLLALFLWMFGLYIPYNYIVDRAQQNNIAAATSKLLLSSLSLGNIIGRILAGLSSFTPKLNSSNLALACTSVAGLMTIASTFVMTHTAAVQFVYGIGYGTFISFTMVLRSVLYVQYMGLESLTSVYGLASLAMGVAALVGTAVAQALQSGTGNYTFTFLFSGSCHVASGASFALLYFVNKCEKSDTDSRRVSVDGAAS